MIFVFILIFFFIFLRLLLLILLILFFYNGLLGLDFFALSVVVPLEHDRLCSLYVMLTLAIDVLEEVEAARQHEVQPIIPVLRTLA